MDANKAVTIPVETVGLAYLEVLRARDKYSFSDSGTDFRPGRARASGRHPAWRVG